MSVQMIQQRLQSYNCKSEIEEQQAIREITQEVVLAALGRGDFFKHALFLFKKIQIGINDQLRFCIQLGVPARQCKLRRYDGKTDSGVISLSGFRAYDGCIGRYRFFSRRMTFIPTIQVEKAIR